MHKVNDNVINKRNSIQTIINTDQYSNFENLNTENTKNNQKLVGAAVGSG
jgi:protein tyrosine/serine phosphatase